jgi:hypothetical protein
MTKSATSIFVWGIYLALTGIGLTAVPDTLIPILGFAGPQDFWPRVAGKLAIALGYYYLRAGRDESLRNFYALTVHGRLGQAVILALLGLLNVAPASVILFGAFDALGAVWTYLALRSEGVSVFSPATG